MREEFESWVYQPMDAWPTPEDYATIVREGVSTCPHLDCLLKGIVVDHDMAIHMMP